MIKPNLFKKPQNKLEGGTPVINEENLEIPEELCVLCSSCGSTLFRRDVENSGYVCPECGWHFSMSARERVGYIADKGTFKERDADMSSKNLIDFPDYEDKLEKHRRFRESLRV